MAMRRLVATDKISKEEWLRYRKQGITGTDVGAITGFNPYVSAMQVYLDKITEDVEEFDNEAMRQGRDLEEYVAQRFTEVTGLKVRRANAIYYNVGHPIMLADFDRLVVGQRAGVECKTVSPYSADKWTDGKIPLHYQMQVQHYLAVSGYECWYIVALVLGKELIVHKIERDEELIQYLITIEERFWNEHVLKRIMPEPDGSKACSEMIGSMYFKSDAKKSMELMGCSEMLNRRAELVSLIEKMEEEKNTIDQKIKLQMQDSAYAFTDKYKISWVSSEASRLDTKRLKEEQPSIYKEYCKTTNSRRFTVSAA